jgi:ACS family glucarate transporter-like MFS transporter
LTLEGFVHATGRTSVRWRVLALLVVISFVAYVLRTNISVAAKLMMPELGLDEVQMGLVFWSFTLAYALLQFPGGVLCGAMGCRRALTTILVAWGLLTIATAAVPGGLILSSTGSLAALIGIRFLHGLANAPLYPGQAGVVAQWFPRSGWALPHALTSSGLTLGAAVASPLVAWLMVTLGWRAAFYWTAPLAFLVAAAWWWYVRDRPADHAGVGEGELSLVRAGRRSFEGAVPRSLAWRLVLRNRETMLLAASYLCMNYVFYIFFSWFYIYLVDERGFSLLEGGVMGALPWTMGAVGAAVGGWACDRLCVRIGPRWGCRLPCVVGLVLVGLFLFAGATATNPYAAVLWLSLCFGFTQVTEGAYWSGATFVAGEHAAPATGILNTGGNLGGVICTPLIPILAKWLGWLPALATGTVFALIGAALWFFIDVERPLTTEER